MPPGSLAAELTWVADRCLRVTLGSQASTEATERVRTTLAALRAAALPALVDLTPAYASVLLTFDLARLDAPASEQAVRAALAASRTTTSPPSRQVEIPVCYCPDCGPDLADVARLHALAPEEVARLHAEAHYRVAFLGFAPGFPYLLGLPERLSTPRLERPRRSVPAGSVAIAGAQAGIYPEATPGGWRLVGRTSLRLFEVSRAAPALLAPGERVRFVASPHVAPPARADRGG